MTKAEQVRLARWRMEVPKLPRTAKGTKALEGRDKTHVTRAEVLAILVSHTAPVRASSSSGGRGGRLHL